MSFSIKVVRDERAMEEYAEPVAGHYLEAWDDDHRHFSEPITTELVEQLGQAYLAARRIVREQADHPLSVFVTSFLIFSTVLLPGGGL